MQKISIIDVRLVSKYTSDYLLALVAWEGGAHFSLIGFLHNQPPAQPKKGGGPFLYQVLSKGNFTKMINQLLEYFWINSSKTPLTLNNPTCLFYSPSPIHWSHVSHLTHLDIVYQSRQCACHHCSLLSLLHFWVCFIHAEIFTFEIFSRHSFLVATSSHTLTPPWTD